MGNTVIWKPSPTQQLAAQLTMELLEEAGLPPGRHQHAPRRRPRRLRGRCSTTPTSPASTSPARRRRSSTCGAPIGENIASYRSYPRIVGETGGKDFIVAHPVGRPRRAARRDDPRCLRVPGPEVLGRLARLRRRARCGRRSRTSSSPSTEALTMGDVTDLSNFMGAVIDDRAFAKHKAAIARAKRDKHLDDRRRRQVDDSVGYFVRPDDRRVAATRPTRCSPTSTSARSWPSTSTTDGQLREGRGPDGVVRAVRPDRRDHRPGPRGHRVGAQDGCASRPATSTSTTSPPAPSWASSRSAAAGPRAPTTRPAPRSTCCAGPRPRSIKETFVPPKDYRYPHMG